MILSPKTIKSLNIIRPCLSAGVFEGVSYGLGHAGYDLRIAEDYTVYPQSFMLASVMEQIYMPNDIVGVVHDKSTWARLGLSVNNTIVEPGWVGYLTLELINDNAKLPVYLKAGMGIAQIIFHRMEEATDSPYDGKYQNQKSGPQPAKF